MVAVLFMESQCCYGQCLVAVQENSHKNIPMPALTKKIVVTMLASSRPGVGNLPLRNRKWHFCPFTAALLPFYKPGKRVLKLASLPLIKEEDLFLFSESIYWKIKLTLSDLCQSLKTMAFCFFGEHLG